MTAPEDSNGWRRLHPLTPALRAGQLLYAIIAGVLASQASQGPTVIIILVITI
ncbi:MAG: hypothetical protein GWN99_04775, partial [Gemmatimonadetes bacterium]|nr:hypothetical protein [Gemmatimonadota bacterium]NIV22616.1 hypothetical protein [Gemmatimonadota bacterium]